ncbi:MAG: TVP38/TMEM64 family protein [Desulfovibrionales bacterium]
MQKRKNANFLDKGNLLRIGLVVAVAAVIVLFFALDLDRYLTLAYLKQTREQFQTLYASHTPVVLGAFFLIYVVATALSLPGAAVLTLAAGALFGFWTGLVLVSFASTIGATLAFVLARFLLRDWVQHKFGKKLEKINTGVEREGSFYLFTLRLVPVFPFWLINLAMALTPIKTWTFYWISQVGMLPGTAVYVNAGKQLGEIDTLGGILSWNIILSFALLGIFPLAVKKLMALYRRRTGKPEKPIHEGS